MSVVTVPAPLCQSFSILACTQPKLSTYVDSTCRGPITGHLVGITKLRSLSFVWPVSVSNTTFEYVFTGLARCLPSLREQAFADAPKPDASDVNRTGTSFQAAGHAQSRPGKLAERRDITQQAVDRLRHFCAILLSASARCREEFASIRDQVCAVSRHERTALTRASVLPRYYWL